MLTKIKLYLFGALLFGSIAFLFKFHFNAVEDAKQATANKLNIYYSVAIRNTLQRKIEIERNLNTRQEKINAEKDRKIADLARDVRNLNNRVQQFAKSSSAGESNLRPGSADGAVAGIAKTSAGEVGIIYQENADFLAREASRADEVVIALEACYRSYDSVREELKPKAK